MKRDRVGNDIWPCSVFVYLGEKNLSQNKQKNSKQIKISKKPQTITTNNKTMKKPPKSTENLKKTPLLL